MSLVAENAVRRFMATLVKLGCYNHCSRYVIAVSGGADSMALAYLASLGLHPSRCIAITIDHKFRDQSTNEARGVAEAMGKLGVQHEIIEISWTKIAGEQAGQVLPRVQRMEEDARIWRYRLLSQACLRHGACGIMTGHHMGDQAETLLMRFVRSSGVSGLAGIPEVSRLPVQIQALSAVQRRQDRVQGVEGSGWAQLELVRPLLGFEKPELYEVCREAGIEWFEDESNRDTRFKRNALRKIIQNNKDPFGVGELVEVCRVMQRHRVFGSKRVEDMVAKYVEIDEVAGIAYLDAEPIKGGGHCPPWADNPAVARRLVTVLLNWTKASSNPPELRHINQALNLILGYYRKSKEHAKPVCVAGAYIQPPTAKTPRWVLGRQPPSRSEEDRLTVEGMAIGEAIEWDGRYGITVCPAISCQRETEEPQAAEFGANVTWGVTTLKSYLEDYCDRETAISRAGALACNYYRLVRYKAQKKIPRALHPTVPVILVAQNATRPPELLVIPALGIVGSKSISSKFLVSFQRLRQDVVPYEVYLCD